MKKQRNTVSAMIQGSYPRTSHPDNATRFDLRITDDASGEILADISLDHEQFMAMMSCLVFHAPVTHGDLTRVGKNKVTYRLPTPESLSRPERDEKVIREAVEKEYAADLYDEIDWRHTNQGLRVIGYRWLEEE